MDFSVTSDIRCNNAAKIYKSVCSSVSPFKNVSLFTSSGFTSHGHDLSFSFVDKQTSLFTLLLQ